MLCRDAVRILLTQVVVNTHTACDIPSIRAVRIQYSNDGKSDYKFNGILAGFAMSSSANIDWQNIKNQAARMTFVHYESGAQCWPTGGLQDSTSARLRSQISPYPPTCASSSDPYTPNYPSGFNPIRSQFSCSG